jgi:hypothetical protein
MLEPGPCEPRHTRLKPNDALSTSKKAPRSCWSAHADLADPETPDSVLIMLERSCGELARS